MLAKFIKIEIDLESQLILREHFFDFFFRHLKVTYTLVKKITAFRKKYCTNIRGKNTTK